MQIEFRCSNCNNAYKTRAIVGIPHGMFSLGCRAVGDGDLIEAEPIKRFITDGLNRKEFGYDQIQVLTEVEYAPVIVPADKEGTE